jgi:type III pantothenate kinase
MHFLVDGERVDLPHETGLTHFGHETVHYICVHENLARRIAEIAPRWVELMPPPTWRTAYRGMGIDRIAACLGLENGEGVAVDAGSAVTVDVMRNGRHLGGWIQLGWAAYRSACEAVSPRLQMPPEAKIPGGLPQATVDALAYGFYEPLRLAVEAVADGLPIVLTGGDAWRLRPLWPEARVDENLVFKGMAWMVTRSH